LRGAVRHAQRVVWLKRWRITPSALSAAGG